MRNESTPEYTVIKKLEELINSIANETNKTEIGRIKALYTPIVEQYEKICRDNNMNPLGDSSSRWLVFWERVRKSIEFVANNRYLLDATESLNTLAKVWDDEVKGESRTRSHVFFFCCNEDDIPPDKTNSIYTRMFFDFAPPDQRLICIFMPSQTRCTSLVFFEVLHEVGHYIGRRIRSERVAMYRHAVAAELCNQVYLRLMQNALGEETVLDIHANIEDDICFSTWLRELSFDIRTCVLNAYRSLKVDLDKAYDKAKCVMEMQIAKEASFTLLQKDAAKNALNNGYFSFVTPTVQEALGSCRNCVENAFMLSFEHISSQSKTYIEENISVILNELFGEIQSTTHRPQWIDNCEKHFKEPGADLFMIRLADLKTHEYLRLMLTSAFNSWNSQETSGEEKESFLEFLLNSELFPKIVGVLYTVFAADKERIIKGHRLFKNWCLKDCNLWCVDKVKRESLERGYELIREALSVYDSERSSAACDDEVDLLEIFNPIYRVSKYIADVKDRFWKCVDSRGKEADIRETTRKRMIKLIKPFKYPMPWFQLMRFFCNGNNSIVE